MVKKGKKKKQAATASTSGDASSEQSQQQVSQQQEQEKQETSTQASSQALPGSSQQKQQKVSEDPQRRQVVPGPSQQQQQQKVVKGPQPQQISQQQVAWGPPKQQQVPQKQQQVPQQQVPQQQVPQQQVPQQQQVARSSQQQIPQQQQTVWRLPQQPQQIPPQAAWVPQQQQIPQGQPQQQAARGLPQQPQQIPPQAAWVPQQQQIPQGQPQQQAARGIQQQPQQIPSQQAAWVPRQQQIPQGQPQQQRAWGLPQQQQIAQSQPSQQQQQQQQQIRQAQPRAWGVQQQVPQQQQPAWGPRQQVPQNLQQQQQIPQTQPQQTAWGLPQQQVPQSQQQQQQGAQRQQQQKVSIEIGGSGDNRQVQAMSSGMQQPSTSASPLDQLSSRLNVMDPFDQKKVTEVEKLNAAQSKAYFEQIPKRKNPMKAGTVGQKITVWTNMFEIMFNDKFVTNAVHYDIAVQPFKESPVSKRSKRFTAEDQIVKLPKALCRNIFEQFRSKYFSNRYPAYDGNKNAFSANDLPVNEIEAVFSHTNNRGQEKQYQIVLRKVANIDLSWIKNLKPGLDVDREQKALQVLDIVMRHAPESRFVNIGRSLFWDIPTNENTRETLANGLTLAHGGYMSGVLGWKPYLNVDVSHKAFTVQKRVLQYIAEAARVHERNLTYDNVIWIKDKLNNFFKGLKVIYQIPGRANTKRTHRIYEISVETSSSKFSVLESNGTEREYTMLEYFRVLKGYKIIYPYLPTLRAVTTGNKTLLPMELCIIAPDQPIRKLNEEQTANMIKQTATDAPTRKQRIENAFNKINVNNSPVMKEFRLSVDARMKQVDARVLPPPELKYAQRTAMVSKGVWRLQPFKDAKNLEENSWTILDLSGEQRIDNFIHDFVELLRTTAREVGMLIGPAARPYRNFSIRNWEPMKIKQYFNENKKLKLIVVIIPDRTDLTYGTVKKITEMEVGVLTQCMKFRTLSRVNPATVRNILLKINSKLNGINHVFNTMPPYLNNCMLVGADVTHPAPDSKESPSIAAVAASRDNSAFQYNVALRLQQAKQEIISDLENIISLQLQIYKSKTGCIPQRLIYYRDGVSEGQLATVMYYEIEAIRKACYSASPQRKIQITCLIVQKRHHVRLFPTNERDSDDRHKNVRAGTIVDTAITHPDHIDFYLVSHASIQGTARPTKYRCLCNESNFSEDQLEQMTYYLCHMYARCTRSVSYPAPTYYAHLAAYRGRALLQVNRDFRLENLKREQENFQLRMGESPMFFV